MIEIIANSGSVSSFVNTIWVTLDENNEAHNVFLLAQPDIDAHVVTIKSKDDLPEQDLFKLIKSGISFREVDTSTEFNLMEKSRLFRIKKELTEFLTQNLSVEAV